MVERSQLRTLARSQKMTLSFEDPSTEQHSYAGQHTQSPLPKTFKKRLLKLC